MHSLIATRSWPGRRSALSLTEILVAIAVFCVALIPVVTSFSTMFRQRKKVDDRAIVSGYARSILEECRYREHGDLIMWVRSQGAENIGAGESIVLPADEFYPNSLRNRNSLVGNDAEVQDLEATVYLTPRYGSSTDDGDVERNTMKIRVLCTWTDRSISPFEERELCLSGLIVNERAANKWPEAAP